MCLLDSQIHCTQKILISVEDEDNKSLEKWTGERIKEIVPEERREHYETKHRSRVNEFYRRAAELQNFVEANGWKLPLKFQKIYCSFLRRK